jgi:hypothetical protein
MLLQFSHDEIGVVISGLLANLIRVDIYHRMDIAYRGAGLDLDEAKQAAIAEKAASDAFDELTRLFEEPIRSRLQSQKTDYIAAFMDRE